MEGKLKHLNGQMTINLCQFNQTNEKQAKEFLTRKTHDVYIFMDYLLNICIPVTRTMLENTTIHTYISKGHTRNYYSQND